MLHVDPEVIELAYWTMTASKDAEKKLSLSWLQSQLA